MTQDHRHSSLSSSFCRTFSCFCREGQQISPSRVSSLSSGSTIHTGALATSVTALRSKCYWMLSQLVFIHFLSLYSPSFFSPYFLPPHSFSFLFPSFFPPSFFSLLLSFPSFLITLPLSYLFSPSSFTRMFWRVVSHMNNTQRQQLLYFATGSATLPAATDTTDRTAGKIFVSYANSGTTRTSKLL